MASNLTAMIPVLSAGLLYIVCSAGLITFNKSLMQKDHFPFAMALVLIHNVVGSALAGTLFLVKPSLFPSLTDENKKVNVDSKLILQGTLPIAVFFSAQLVLSNMAYMFASVAFLQMMKEGNLVLVYTLSLIVGMEAFSWRSVQVLLFVIAATTLTIKGELNFSLTGFIIQGSGQLFESSRIVLQGMLLTCAGRKLDVLSYALLVSPQCMFVLGMMTSVVVFTGFGSNHIAMPTGADLLTWWPTLLANACLAFALNCSISLFMQCSSPVAFILAGILKDATIVTLNVLLMGEEVSELQVLGFVMQICLIFLWSMMKTFPERFKHGVIQGIWALAMGAPDDSKNENAKVGGKGDSYGTTAVPEASSKC